MELLSADMVQREPGERILRHGVLGPMTMWAVFALPAFLALHWRAEVAASLASFPWVAWLVVAPMVLFGVAFWLLCLFTIGQVAYRAMLPTNWLLRASTAGLVLNLRSFQNAHFPNDGPTVVRLAWPEIGAARKVSEWSSRRDGSGTRTIERKRWLEIELASVDTRELEALVARERTRPGPEGSFLGLRGRSRSSHVPVFVARPGAVRVEWLGGALEALRERVEIRQPLKLDLDRQTPDVD